MRTYYIFESEKSLGLRGFTDAPEAEKLPAEYGPWTFVRQIGPDEDWDLDISRAVVAAGIISNGSYLFGPMDRPASTKPIIESDRVEGTAVLDASGHQIGTIRRLLIEKVSGRVLYVDVTFGGFLGMGVHHLTIPWDKLSYDREYSAYQTDITEEQVRGAPTLYTGDGHWPDRERERDFQDYWNRPPR